MPAASRLQVNPEARSDADIFLDRCELRSEGRRSLWCGVTRGGTSPIQAGRYPTCRMFRQSLPGTTNAARSAAPSLYCGPACKKPGPPPLDSPASPL